MLFGTPSLPRTRKNQLSIARIGPPSSPLIHKPWVCIQQNQEWFWLIEAYGISEDDTAYRHTDHFVLAVA